jgi:hypothetical protein
MTISITGVTPDTVPADGGYLLKISGEFPIGERLNVHIGTVGDATDPKAYSGKAGQGDVIFSATGDLVRCHTRLLDPGITYKLYVKSLDSVDEDTLDAALTAVVQDFKSSVFSMRKALPPWYRAGPRGIDLVLPKAPITEQWEEVGMIEAVTSAIGEADNEIGGMHLTRLSSDVAQGVDTFPVETTHGWLSEGRVSVSGVVYHYTGKTATTFTGVTHISEGASAPGAKVGHGQGQSVLDLGNPYNAIQRVRRAMLIEYAEDDDLDVIGRNLAVNRLPFVKGDDQYRAVIKALAYNPRATVYGLELLMDALVGAGNYEIFEDLIQHNNTVFIRILPSAGLETREAGKMFLGGAEFPKATTQTKAVLSADPVSQGTIQGAPFRNEDVFADFRGALPSALTITDFDGDTGTQVWNWQDDSTGLSEGSGTNSTADYVQLIDASGSTYGYYEHFARVIPESRAQLNILMQISSWTTAANQYDRMVIGIEDGAKNIRVGFGESGGNVQFGFITDASTWIGSPVTYDPIAGPFSWSEFTLIKDQEDQVVLLVNGNEVLRTDYANFPSSTNNRFVFGPQNTTGQITVNVKQAGLFSNTVLT